jgi:hypothetical protein
VVRQWTVLTLRRKQLGRDKQILGQQWLITLAGVLHPCPCLRKFVYTTSWQKEELQSNKRVLDSKDRFWNKGNEVLGKHGISSTADKANKDTQIILNNISPPLFESFV